MARPTIWRKFEDAVAIMYHFAAISVGIVLSRALGPVVIDLDYAASITPA